MCVCVGLYVYVCILVSVLHIMSLCVLVHLSVCLCHHVCGGGWVRGWVDVSILIETRAHTD